MFEVILQLVQYINYLPNNKRIILETNNYHHDLSVREIQYTNLELTLISSATRFAIQTAATRRGSVTPIIPPASPLSSLITTTHHKQLNTQRLLKRDHAKYQQQKT